VHAARGSGVRAGRASGPEARAGERPGVRAARGSGVCAGRASGPEARAGERPGGCAGPAPAGERRVRLRGDGASG